MIAGIVFKLYVEHRAMSLGKRIDRLGDVNVVASSIVVRLRSSAAIHALVGIISIDPELAHTINLQYTIDTAISIGAIDGFAHTAASLSPCRQFVGSQRAEIVATGVIDHIMETKVAVVAIFGRSNQLKTISKHHASSTSGIQHIVFSNANAQLWLSKRFELCLFAQFYIDSYSITLFVGINLAMLVMLHDIHLSGIFGRDILCGKVITTTKHIKPTDVEVGNTLAHIADGTIIRNVYARQIL